MSKLFISYRRDDLMWAKRLKEDLSKQIAAEIFLDVDDIDEVKFADSLEKHLIQSDGMLLIASKETFAADRIHNDKDWIRREITLALSKRKRIIPVCENDYTLPLANTLPTDIHPILELECVQIHVVDWESGILRLAKFITKAIPAIKPIISTTTQSTTQTQPIVPTHRRAPTTLIFALLVLVFVAMAAIGGWTLLRPPTPTVDPMIVTNPSQTPGYTLTTSTESTSVPTLSTTQLPQSILMVKVPTGCFQMGNATQSDAQPQHKVCITHAFWIDRYEVTNDVYQQFVSAGGYQQAQFWSNDGWQWLQKNRITGPKPYAGFTQGTLPRVGISWYEAEAYARWQGGRLPTEAEWEYVARGPDAHLYPWGDTYEVSKANIDERDEPNGMFLGHTVVVNSFPKGTSWIDVYQLAGNAAEWVRDFYDSKYYQSLTLNDPQGAQNGKSRVVRGGSWQNKPVSVSSAYRAFAAPESRENYIGFRVLKENLTD
jgi:formylglycine-generating enzyme required for sulfatase activity